ncbi:MAG TPA: rhomboid family intramembrane serine protease [Kofleriaceae bacterium]|nr:rhomboid family intramembrane serine protease [Kofleriaceae bacterium]
MLLFDFLLLSVIVVTAYLGPMVLRRLGPGHRQYGWMLLADLALAIGALASRRNGGDSAAADLVGTVAIGGGVCLVFVPPVLRNLARRALLADRLRLARALVDARELLQPGMGARQESELISTILEVRSGQVETAVGRLRERRDQMAEPVARRPLDERIVMTYLYARRWDDAVAWFEQNIDGPLLPLSPQLAVEMVRAYCERGELLKAAALVERLEGTPSIEEPIWSLLIHRARLVFLAFAGRTGAVEAIVGPSGPLGAMPESARCYWTGMARLMAGDTSGARSSLERAAALSGRDDRSREQAETTLGKMDVPGVAGPHSMPEPVTVLADRLSQQAEDRRHAEADSSGSIPLAPEGRGAPDAGPRRRRHSRPPRLTGVGWREVPVTSAFLAANILIAVAMVAVSGETADMGALVDFGANVKSATAAGDWWRLVSSNFLHVGVLHLALNMYGLWVLGRLVEQFLGRTRMAVLFVLTGVCGAAASLAFGGPATSAGASGAVFGLLGAAVAELALHRKLYPRRWSGALLGNLIFLAVANVVIGFMYPMIDQSAHLGGLAAGVALGALLSRKLAIAKRVWMRGLVTGLAVVSGGALAYGAFGAATSDFSATLASYPRVPRRLGTLEVVVPAEWEQVSRNQIDDTGLSVLFHLQRLRGPISRDSIDAQVEAAREKERSEGARQLGLAGVRLVDDVRLELPPPWRSRELEAELEAGVTGEQTFRIAVVAREAGGELWLAAIYYPASLGDDLSRTMSEILRSARPIGSIPADSAAE